MTLDEYKSQIIRLKETFGDKHFPEERIKTLWEKIKTQGFNEFKRATDKIILEKYTPPPASVILESINEFKDRVRKEEKAEVLFDCSWCGQSGFVTARPNESSDNSVAFRCACEWFSFKAKGNFTVWDNAFKSRYYPEFYRFQEWSDFPEKMEHQKTENKNLIKKYSKEIRASLGDKWAELPYDPTERINIEEFTF